MSLLDNTYAIIKTSVNHSKLSVVKSQFITTKSHNSIFINFKIETEDWKDVTATAIFNDKYIRVLDSDFTCDIPEEALVEDGIFTVGLFGVGDNYRINTNTVQFRSVEGCYDDGLPSTEITQTLYEQIMAIINNKASKYTTIAGLALDKNIDKNDLLNALDIEEGAQKNIVPDWAESDGPASIKNKPTKLSEFEDDLGDNPEHMHSQYITKENDPTVPSWAKQPEKPIYTYDEIQGAPPTVDLNGYASENYVSEAVSAHNTSSNAHNDIRELVNGKLSKIIFATYEDAERYAREDKNAYVGQPVIVANKNGTDIYMISGANKNLIRNVNEGNIMEYIGEIPDVISILDIRYKDTVDAGNIYTIVMTNGVTFDFIAPRGDSGEISDSQIQDITNAISEKIFVPKKLSDLEGDSANRVVSDTDIERWNSKSEFSGDYDALSNKPDIPTALSELNEDATHRVVSDADIAYWNSKSSFSGNYDDLVGVPTIDIGIADIKSAVSEHNSSESAHNDIRVLLKSLSDKINSILDSDDITLDQLSEIVAYIKSNKTLLDEVTTNKVNINDIVDDLNTNISNKPLSAAQGHNLKLLIDAIVLPTLLSELSEDTNHRTVTDQEKVLWNNKSEFSGLYDDLVGTPIIPTVPLQDISENTNARHQHANKKILDGITKAPLTEHQSLTAYRTSQEQDIIDDDKVSRDDVYDKNEIDRKLESAGKVRSVNGMDGDVVIDVPEKMSQLEQDIELGNIGNIYVNGDLQPVDENKNVNIDISLIGSAILSKNEDGDIVITGGSGNVVSEMKVEDDSNGNVIISYV